MQDRRVNTGARKARLILNEMHREKLAAYAHEAWAGWMKYIFEKSTKNADGTVTIPSWAVSRWKRQADTLYADLPDAEKKSDLVEADRILNIIQL